MNLSASEDEGELKLTVNKNFAKQYEKSRRSEELMKLKARYGNASLKDIEEDSDSESEDEDAEELTPAMEQKWLKTLAALKSDDPRLYDNSTKFFDSEDETDNQPKRKRKKEKKITLKDMDRKVITERDGKYSDYSSDDDDTAPPHSKNYYEEQAEIRKSIKDAQQGSSDDDDDLFTVKVKTAAEKEAEEEEYRKFVKGHEADVDDRDKEELTGLREFWNRDNMTEADRFLKDYILEKKYIADMSPSDNTSEEESDAEADRPFQFQDLSEDEDLERADKFELKYNFRFEEPDPDFIKTYPRTIESSMRSETNSRKEKRAKLRVRKEKEKEKKTQELNRLKNLKRQEIEEKLQAIQAESGASSMPFTSEELDEDFDPEEHDRKMREMFAEEDNDDEEDDGNLTKPQFDYNPEIDDNDDWDKFKVSENAGGNEAMDAGDADDYVDIEDPEFNMDADYDPNAATLEDRNYGLDGRSKKGKRKKNRLRKALEKKKPVFDPDDKTFEEYLDEFYGLECEDTIGELKCRFPYREVPANDFGLTVGEILEAKDKELNSWNSLKKTVQYRTNEEEYKDVSKFRRKGRDQAKKQRLLPSLFKEKESDEASSEVVKDTADNSASNSLELSQQDAGETNQPETERLSEQPVNASSSTDRAIASDKTNQSDSRSKTKMNSKKRKGKWKGKQTDDVRVSQSSRGMSFTRMEAFGLHSEVKRVKNLMARDKKRKTKQRKG